MTGGKNLLVSKKPISWLDGVNPYTGEITQENHDLKGANLKGKIIRIPYSIGSTVGSYTFLKLKMTGKAPYKIILEKPDAITMPAVLTGIKVEVLGKKTSITLENLEETLPKPLLKYLKLDGESNGATKLIPISSAHVSGVSYKTIGDAGIKFLEDLVEKKYRARVLTTLNPAGMDLERYREQGVPVKFAEKQLEIINLYMKLGVIPTCTCTPYLVGNCPLSGANVSWAESSAVVYANSVLKAKTNQEGGIKSLVSALTGLTPNYGMHIDINRKPRVKVTLKVKTKGYEFGLLGFWIGKQTSKPVYIDGLVNFNQDDLKCLGAAGAASGKMEIFHYERREKGGKEKFEENLVFSGHELMETKEELSDFSGKPDLIVLGCPHFSLKQFLHLAKLMENRRVKKCDFHVYTSRAYEPYLKRSGLKGKLERAGVKVFYDTCMVVSPLEEIGYRETATDSAKAAKYLKTLSKQEVFIDSLENLVETATK